MAHVEAQNVRWTKAEGAGRWRPVHSATPCSPTLDRAEPPVPATARAPLIAELGQATQHRAGGFVQSHPADGELSHPGTCGAWTGAVGAVWAEHSQGPLLTSARIRTGGPWTGPGPGARWSTSSTSGEGSAGPSPQPPAPRLDCPFPEGPLCVLSPPQS